MFNMNHYLRFSIYKNDLVIIDINNDEFFIMNDVNHKNIRLLTDVEEELLAAGLIQSLTPIDGNVARRRLSLNPKRLTSCVWDSLCVF